MPEALRLVQVAELVTAMLRLPFFRSLPGDVLEEILAYISAGLRTGTYDFVDVISKKEQIGWQVKCTKATTPVTWKRAKIPNKEAMIAASNKNPDDAQRLGDAIMEFCNAHALKSAEKYNLQRLVYSRLVDFTDGRLMYFERALPLNGRLFEPRDFRWRWSEQKKSLKKEQLSALHGIHVPSGKAWFAWHGLSENQLHFKGERAWWPPPGSSNRIDFTRPDSCLSLAEVAQIIANAATGLKELPPS